MNELQQLEAKIRQALPRLQELSDGCKIDYYENIYTIGVDCTLGLNSQIEVDENMTIFSDEYDIIGHEIYLSDALQYLTIYYSIDGSGILKKYDTKHRSHIPLDCQFDISKPLLKDQTKEVIEYLNGLK